ncbi:MAG: hypothetical protein KY440_11940 [Actinobacteria bacterium]|nr:hypothetical protein [Actinomycetota bacterium]
MTAQPECTPRNCWRYTFDVPPGGKDLRIAVQTSRRGDFWTMGIMDPHGNPVEGNHIGGGNAPWIWLPGAEPLGLQRWAIEHRLPNPMPGTWEVKVIVQDTEVGVTEVGVTGDEKPLHLKMRAALDPEPSGVFGLPNLRPRPPYEFGLAAPANPTSGGAVDRHNPALSAAGVEPASCMWDEVLLAAEHGELPPTRCLRFSVGVYEAGSGRVDLQLDGYVRGTSEEGTVTQRIHWPHGRIETRGAGFWEFHMTHGHPHYLDFVRYELDRVIIDGDLNPVLTTAGGSGKTGYYTADQRIADWTSFKQDPQWEASFSCERACIAMGAGWEDHYRWQRPGQYVPLAEGQSGDGLYVVRVRVNAENLLAETTTDDNTAYALVHVFGGEVNVCERGLGDHPWASNAQPVGNDGWPAVRTGAPVGTGCPDRQNR